MGQDYGVFSGPNTARTPVEMLRMKPCDPSTS